MANIFNQKNNLDNEGFNPKPDNTEITASSSPLGKGIWYGSFIFIIPIFFNVKFRNDFNRQQNHINELASGIDVQLTKRRDTLTKLLEAAKGYMAHEKELLSEITRLRSETFQNSKISEKYSQLSSINSRLIATFENYPQLKANESINKLMETSEYIEREIAASRRLYNTAVRDFNASIMVWPKNVVASSMKLSSIPLFKASVEQRKDVEIKF